MKKYFETYFASAVALLAVSAAPAVAADMAVKAPPMVASLPSWTGFYIGINGGGAWGTTGSSTSNVGPDFFFAPANVPAVTAGASRSFDNSGGLAGGQIGYLFQSGKGIFGIEASFDWANFNGSTSNGPTVYTVTPGSTFAWNLRASSDFLATFTGRVGYDMGSWYPYLTGGAAVAHLKYSANFIDTFYPSNVTSSFSRDAVGWVIGLGAEWRVADHWMLRGEYLYMDFDSFGGNGVIACTAGVGACGVPANSTTFNYSAKFRENVGRVALSYRF
jgi:outer membrane immunogenic protein